MINRLPADETFQVLAFVCVPLLLLLAVVLVMLVRGSRTTATFPAFSVAVSQVGRGETYVTYHAEDTVIEFCAEVGRGKKFFARRISVRVPDEMADEKLRNIVSNLSYGLAKLHYQYFIYRRTGSQTIPKEERDAAILELRQMGFELKDSAGHGQIQRAVNDDWRRASGAEAKAKLSKVQELMHKARGSRETFEVLASSDAG